MTNNWGPHFIVPSESLREFSGTILLREELDDELLKKDLDELGLSGPVRKVSNPWYFRKTGTLSWIKIGESDKKADNFPVSWDTRRLENGKYEVLGLMHVFIKQGDVTNTIARQNIVEVTVKN